MPLKELVAVVAPPQAPHDTEGHWASAAYLYGTEFPTDFRGLITKYGSGRFFRGHLDVFNPLTLAGHASLKAVLRMCAGWPLPLDVHPASPGLLPWGRDENGNTYCWLTKGKPDRWPVVYLHHGSESEPRKFPMDVTGFLARLCANELNLTDQPYRDNDRVFTPRPPLR
jgi:hypothetical protein